MKLLKYNKKKLNKRIAMKRLFNKIRYKLDLNKWRHKLEVNKIFFEIFSSVVLGVMGIIISVVGIQMNIRDMKTNESQLKISETNESPYFILECENVWEELEETKENDRIAMRKYTLKNIGGNIRNVSLRLDKYVQFLVPDKKLDKYHKFNYKLQYNTEGIGVYCNSKLTWEEPDKKVVFYEYTSENEMAESERKANELYEYLWNNSIMYIMSYHTTNVLTVQYTDYMGGEKEEKYQFEGSRLYKIDGDLEGISIKVRGEEKIDFGDMQEVGKVLKESMDDWMDEDKEEAVNEKD